MPTTIPRLLLCALLALPWVVLAAAPPQAAWSLECPDPEVAAREPSRALDAFGTRTAQIEALMRGEHLDSVLNGLFAIDIDNAAAIAERVEQLRAFIAAGATEPRAPLCTGASPALDEAALALARARLAFLDQPADKRNLLGGLVDTARLQGAIAEGLDQERRDAEQTGSDAAEARAAAEETALSADSTAQRLLAGKRAVVEKLRQDLAALGAERLARIENRVATYRDTAKRLSRVTAAASDADALDAVDAAYREATGVWIELAQTVAGSETGGIARAAFEVPTLSAAERADFEGLDEWPAYLEAQTQLVNELDATTSRLEARVQQQESVHYQLLSQAATLRAQLLASARAAFDHDLQPVSGDYARQFVLELTVVPHLWRMATRDYLTRLRGVESMDRVDSMLAVGHEIGVLLTLLLIALAFFIAVRALPAWLRRRQPGFLRTRPSGAARMRALWARRLSPYIPWVLAWIALAFIERTIAGSALAWLQPVLPIARMAVIYWFVLAVAREWLLHSRFLVSGRHQPHERTAAMRAFRLFARYVLSAAIFIFVIETVVGRLLAYNLALKVAIYGGVILLAALAWSSRKLLLAAARVHFDGRTGEFLTYLGSGWRAPFGALIVAVSLACVLLLRQLQAQAGEYEATKRLSARLFLRKARTQSPDRRSATPPPEDYARWFEPASPMADEVFVQPANDALTQTLADVANWQQQPNGENSILLYGHKGVGKSTLLARVAERATDLRVIDAPLAGKYAEPGSLATFLGEALACDLRGGVAALLDADAASPPTLILLDDVHNVFLRRLGGFEGYRFLSSLLNAPTTNLFWCATCNLYPWRYLEDVFVREQSFRRVRQVQPWNDEDIRQLIETRHARTGYGLEYDQIILATANDTREFIEARYFRLLWEQSRAIPRNALALWMRSLVFDGSRRLRVTLPVTGLEERIAQLPTDMQFVMAAVMRHENLTTNEAIAVSGMSTSQVRHAFGLAREMGILDEDADARFRISAAAHAALSRVLGGRNLIYE